MRKTRDWLTTVPLLIAFGLTLVVFDVAGRIARLFSLRGFETVMAALQRTLIAIFRIGGTRYPRLARGQHQVQANLRGGRFHPPDPVGEVTGAHTQVGDVAQSICGATIETQAVDHVLAVARGEGPT